MADLLFIVVVAGCFVGLSAFVRACAWIVGRGGGEPAGRTTGDAAAPPRLDARAEPRP
ncbi:MAG TPA: hypothetical protein VLB86_07970 [Gaiellaceae bacterium]|nr:hypothetical protein [Gaiellaceae bacterium]